MGKSCVVGRKRKKFCCMFLFPYVVLFLQLLFCSIGMKFGERLFGAMSNTFYWPWGRCRACVRVRSGDGDVEVDYVCACVAGA